VLDERGLEWRRHLQSQASVTTRRQALAAGWSEKTIDSRLRSGTWRRLQRGTYATFTGDAYAAYGVCIELDGAASHSAEGRWKDTHRDNANLVRHDTRTLRYGWPDVTSKRCDTAIEVSNLLRKNGWRGRPRPCGPGCPVAG
jgi:hypothetical protein